MEKSEFEKKLIQSLESYTLFAERYIKETKKKGTFPKDEKERFCFMYGAACGLRDLALRLKIDVSFYEGYFDKLKEFADGHDILLQREPPEEY